MVFIVACVFAATLTVILMTGGGVVFIVGVGAPVGTGVGFGVGALVGVGVGVAVGVGVGVTAKAEDFDKNRAMRRMKMILS